ncbi:peptide ABC transporter ATP-binding protein [Mergibacter septicus]|uniref:Peptide ABC transporter ATP-binding protein n=1 Tax=Mergibacter septicus TaxID=221402 RepID=A0A8E3MFL1_9PAST|nr:oligopeptide/dipeptide ABC transporter ATP-binding protein [Mergibacter septicus]AWX15014.1 peptide ABC transporter ATP-binding protein [Mergibacter septicus]QDJ12531.1 peptide ABC transporter ATP-binding protein [Mergibacter septicus]QDJ14266.1 peptide ABC transporter ATP-binding protein [Mergibacter septicus]WMR96089.1 ATP-binding cassette domain-containing protein [Mergibacter septicus]
MALLDIRNLCIDIKTANGKVRLVDNVNLTLNEATICGLIGESGSGKSLIAKVICNADKDDWVVTADRFRFNNIELLKISPAKRRQIIGREISMIFQDPIACLDPTRKIGQQLIQIIPNWTFKGRWWRWFGWKKRRAIELLHKVGIKDHHDIMNSYPNEISPGEAQKVMIAMAVSNQPRLLIADEATNSLEATTQKQIFRLLASMNQNNGTSVLLLGNDIVSIGEWCHTISVLYCGQSVEYGSKEAVLENPHHPYTVALIHASPDFSQALPFKSHLSALRGSIPLIGYMPIGCRLGPRCPFAQKKCVIKPQLRRVKQHEFACHYPLNLREHRVQPQEVTPIKIQTENSHEGNE